MEKTTNFKQTVAAAAAAAGLGIMFLATTASAWPSIDLTRVIGQKLSLAGHDLNGVSLNSEVLDGSQIVSISTTDAELDGRLLESISIKRSKLKAINHKGKKVSHKKMDGVILTGDLDNGETIRLRVENHYRGDFPHKDTFFYVVTYETADGWLPLCGTDEADEPVSAVALNGSWDFSQGTSTGGSHLDDEFTFTFACRGYVLAKCVEAGYKPWKKARVCTPAEGCELISLSAHHHACTRMLRADYCGDGVSHTQDQVPVNLYDDFEIRYDSQEWDFEAEWDEDGAVCAVRERIAGDAPECIDWIADDDCGDPSHFMDGVLLFSEITPAE